MEVTLSLDRNLYPWVALNLCDISVHSNLISPRLIQTENLTRATATVVQ
jgi:hypothetical protein